MGDNDHDNETVWIERNVAHETSNEVLSLYQLPDREYVADETIKELLSRNGVPEIQLTSDRGHLSSLNDFRVQQVLVDYTGSVLGENFDIGLGAVFQEQADLLDERDRRDALNINNTISLLENPENNNYFSTSLIARLNEILNDPNRHCFSQSEVNSFHETKVEGGALANATRSLFTFDSPNGGAEAPSGIRIEGGAEAPSRTSIGSPNGGAEAPNSNSSGGSEALKRPNSSADGGSEVSKKRKF